MAKEKDIVKKGDENIDDISDLFFFAKGRNQNVEAIEELANKFYRPKKVSSKLLSNWLNNPYKNVNSLQDLSQSMIQTNGILKEFINYKSLILTNDFYIYPSDSFKYKDKETLLKDELKVADYIETYDPKNLTRWVSKRIFQNGEIYIYKRETKKGVLMQEIPTKICKIVMLDENNIYRYAVNMKEIDEKDIYFYPEEIQKAFKKYNNSKGKKNNKDFIGDYYVVGEKGSAFQLNQWDNKGLPYFVHLFPELLSLAEAKNADDLNNSLENYKLLHQKILTDKNGKVLMSKGISSLYNESLKNTVPQGVAVITSPLDIEPIPLGDGSLKNYEYVKNIKEGIYDNAGIASELFNSNAKTKESVMLSSIIDTLVPIQIQSYIQNYLNYELSRKFKRGKWRMQFIPTTYYNRQNEIKTERENLTLFGSKKRYLATLGFTPLESLNLINSENLLEIEKDMKPMQTSHTISGSKGRPEEDSSLEQKPEDTSSDVGGDEDE